MYVANLRSETLKATLPADGATCRWPLQPRWRAGSPWLLDCRAEKTGKEKQPLTSNNDLCSWCWCESAVSSPLSLWQLKFLTLCWWQSPSNYSMYCTSEYSPYYLIYLLFPKGQHYLTPGRTINLYPNPLTSCKHLVAVHFVQEELVRFPF